MSEQNNGIYVNCPYCDTATLISGLDLNKGQIFTGAKLCDQLNGCGGRGILWVAWATSSM